jgi:anti-anti-sigma regulatory factor
MTNLAREFVITMGGVFDSKSARRVAEALACVASGGTLRVDLTRIEEFQDEGLGLLAQVLRASGLGVRVVIRGLGRHQRRLFRYLGVDLAALESALLAVAT